MKEYNYLWNSKYQYSKNERIQLFVKLKISVWKISKNTTIYEIANIDMHIILLVTYDLLLNLHERMSISSLAPWNSNFGF